MPVLKIKHNGVWQEVAGISKHIHTIDDITDFPTSLPADGGDADTLDGKHADEFALIADIEELDAKIGKTSVEDQIAEVIIYTDKQIESALVYVENTDIEALF